LLIPELKSDSAVGLACCREQEGQQAIKTNRKTG
jgi:hypothetical protein